GESFGARQQLDVTYGADLYLTRPDTEGDINGQYEDDDNVNEFGVYAQAEYIINDQFELLGALRADKSSLLDDPVFSPRAALLYKPDPNHTWRATYNRAFSMPTTLNYFLDINGGLASGGAGQLGYYLRAQGSGKDGFSFMNDQGGIAGVRSSFTPEALGGPGQLLPLSAEALWPLMVGFLLQTQQISPQQAALLGQLPIGLVGLNLLDANTGLISPAAGAVIPDTPPLRESTTNTFEIGYQGNFQGRLAIAADVYYTKRENFTSPLLARNPLVLFDGQQLGALLVQAGLPAQDAAALATAVGGVPVGVVSSEDVISPTADIVASYINFGELDYFGADLAVQARLTDHWTFGTSMSWIQDDFFLVDSDTDTEVEDFTEIEDLNDVVGLNAPDFKWSVDVGYTNAGFSASARGRYSSEFSVNSADFVGVGCLPLSNELRGALEASGLRNCVEAYTVFDLGLGYEIAGTGTEILLDVTNVFDVGYETFVGVPEIGRLAILQVRKTF
ncbi:MAG: TonB-dependent receptor, partial [Gemmatimonadetes bacterium]|nr:TonB-dependent receptor [Gemmatimonadota bacterium]